MKIKNLEIVEFMIKEGTENTNEGNWIFYFEELTDKFDITLDHLNDNIYKIIEELENREEVAQVDYNNNSSFSVYFYLAYCTNVENFEEEEN